MPENTPEQEQLLAKVDSQIEKATGKLLEKIEAKLNEARELLKQSKAGTVSEADLKTLSESVEEIRNSVKEAFSQIEKVAKRLDLAIDEIRSIGGKNIAKIGTEVAKVAEKQNKELMLLEFF